MLLKSSFAFLCSTITLLSTATLVAAEAAEVINNIVVFGDSYSDVGNKQRLTNGPLWSEDLSVGWNASLYSFAFSGAVCNNDAYPTSNEFIPSIVDQIEMFYDQHLNLDMEETAIIFWVGMNDIYKIFENYQDNEAIEAEYSKVVDCIGTNIRNIRKVFSANKFIVFGMPPLERMPYYASTDLAQSRERAANQLNDQLTKEVEKMNKHLQSLELDLVDIHKMLDDIVDHPAMFEIQNAKDSYWDVCQGQCSDEMDSYVWWDKTHLTGGVHRLIANSILMAGSLAPETFLDDTINVNSLLKPSPIYPAKRNTGEIGKIIEKINQDKLSKEKQQEQQQQHQDSNDAHTANEASKQHDPNRASNNFIYFGISATLVVCIAFMLFMKGRRRRNLAALSGLLKSNKDRGRFVPLRNMDTEV